MASDVDKLRVLIPHWCEHASEHASEYQAWSERAGVAKETILAAAEHMLAATLDLRVALEMLGGPLGDDARV
jgi:hypothetical protein